MLVSMPTAPDLEVLCLTLRLTSNSAVQCPTVSFPDPSLILKHLISSPLLTCAKQLRSMSASKKRHPCDLMILLAVRSIWAQIFSPNQSIRSYSPDTCCYRDLYHFCDDRNSCKFPMSIRKSEGTVETKWTTRDPGRSFVPPRNVPYLDDRRDTGIFMMSNDDDQWPYYVAAGDETDQE